MKRKKPDPLQFAMWAASSLSFDDTVTQHARGAWLHWRAFAERAGCCPGTSGSFDNAMAKIRCPDFKPDPSKRTRRYRGCSVKLWEMNPDLPGDIDMWMIAHRRYRLGEERQW